ncbi:hypothetical protein ABIF70_010346 [Bradyrhizobium japonicum]
MPRRRSRVSDERGPLLQVPHKEIWLRGADAIHDVSHKPTTGGDPFADLGDEHFEPFAPQSAGGVLVTSGQRWGNCQVVPNEKCDGLGHDREVAVGSFELPAHAVKSSDQRRVATCVSLWIQKAVERGIHDGRLVAARTLCGKFQSLSDAIGDVSREFRFHGVSSSKGRKKIVVIAGDGVRLTYGAGWACSALHLIAIGGCILVIVEQAFLDETAFTHRRGGLVQQ